MRKITIHNKQDNQIMLNNKNNKQIGAILSQEIIIWIFVILAALAAAATLWSSNKDSGSKLEAKMFFSTDIVRGVENCILTRGSFASCNAIDKIPGVDANTPWGASWTLTINDPSVNKFTIVYPLDGLSDADIFGEGLVDYLSKLGVDASPTYSASTDDMTVIYTR